MLALPLRTVERDMTLRRLHWLERFQVRTAMLVGAVATYFVLFPLLRGPDPEGPLSLLVGGGAGRVALFVIAFWVLGGFCGALTVSARREGVLAALLIGMGGLSLRSPQIRSLLWFRMDALTGLYETLILEVLLLAAVLVAGDIIAAQVRRALGRARPGWVWKALPADPARKGGELAEVSIDRTYYLGGVLDTVLIGALIRLFASLGRRGTRKAAGSTRRSELLVRTGKFLILALVIAAALLLVLMRSSDRGQILFALVAGFFVATWVAHQVFPTPLAAASWVYPIILAVCLYALGAASGAGAPPQGWIDVRIYARALPMDWLTAGCGGSLLGCWVSARTHDARRIQRLEEEEA